jgi:hypothetical protein
MDHLREVKRPRRSGSKRARQAGRAIFPNANLDKLTRDAIAKVRDNRSNWTPDELAALNEAAAGTPTQRALRMVGALAPNSPITTLLHSGGLVGGIATGGIGTAGSLGTMATGLAARTAVNPITNSAVDRLSSVIRSGGSAPTTTTPMGTASPLAALLMGSGVNALQPVQPYAPGLGAVFASSLALARAAPARFPDPLKTTLPSVIQLSG